jgi:ParB family chromosome partitioning protein
VTKSKVLEAVRAFAPQEELVLSRLKKDRLAAEAERLAAGSGWLPPMFVQVEGEATTQAEDTEDADLDEEAEEASMQEVDASLEAGAEGEDQPQENGEETVTVMAADAERVGAHACA